MKKKVSKKSSGHLFCRKVSHGRMNVHADCRMDRIAMHSSKVKTYNLFETYGRVYIFLIATNDYFFGRNKRRKISKEMIRMAVLMTVQKRS